MRLFIILLVAICLIATSHTGDQAGRKLRVVVFGGHSDDPESGAGALIPILTRQGHEVIRANGGHHTERQKSYATDRGQSLARP